ncbi:hypothetical protein GCM10028833_11010 [Glycomyces tarimensis]
MCGSRSFGRLRLDKGSHRRIVHRPLYFEGPSERTPTNCLVKAVQIVVHMGSAAAEAAQWVWHQVVDRTLRAMNDAQQLGSRGATPATHTSADYRCVTLRSDIQSTSKTNDRHRPGRSPPSPHRPRAHPI